MEVPSAYPFEGTPVKIEDESESNGAFILEQQEDSAAFGESAMDFSQYFQPQDDNAEFDNLQPNFLKTVKEEPVDDSTPKAKVILAPQKREVPESNTPLHPAAEEPYDQFAAEEMEEELRGGSCFGQSIAAELQEQQTNGVGALPQRPIIIQVFVVRNATSPEETSALPPNPAPSSVSTVVDLVVQESRQQLNGNPAPGRPAVEELAPDEAAQMTSVSPERFVYYCKRALLDNHSMDQPVTCAVCSLTLKLFAPWGARGHLALLHALRHISSVDVFRCRHCSYGTSVATSMLTHLKREHNVDDCAKHYYHLMEKYAVDITTMIDDCFGKPNKGKSGPSIPRPSEAFDSYVREESRLSSLAAKHPYLSKALNPSKQPNQLPKAVPSSSTLQISTTACDVVEALANGDSSIVDDSHCDNSHEGLDDDGSKNSEKRPKPKRRQTRYPTVPKRRGVPKLVYKVPDLIADFVQRAMTQNHPLTDLVQCALCNQDLALRNNGKVNERQAFDHILTKHVDILVFQCRYCSFKGRIIEVVGEHLRNVHRMRITGSDYIDMSEKYQDVIIALIQSCFGKVKDLESTASRASGLTSQIPPPPLTLGKVPGNRASSTIEHQQQRRFASGVVHSSSKVCLIPATSSTLATVVSSGAPTTFTTSLQGAATSTSMSSSRSGSGIDVPVQSRQGGGECGSGVLVESDRLSDQSVHINTQQLHVEQSVCPLPVIMDVDAPLPVLRENSLAEKSSHSYIELITQAVLNSPENCMSLTDIYDWMEENAPWIKSRAPKSWKNSIRHALSKSARFKRFERDGAPWWSLDWSEGRKSE